MRYYHYLHKGVVYTHDEDLPGIRKLGVIDVARHMLGRASAGEGCGDTDNDAIRVFKLFLEVDFVAWRVFEKDLQVGDLLTDLHKRPLRGMELAAGSKYMPWESGRSTV